MDPSVKAAWISSSVALAVAVIGVVATGVAQWRGSKTANANALALFKRQAEEQEKIRAEAMLERRRTAFLADRRAVYAKFMAAMRRLADETTKYEETKERGAALVAEQSDGLEQRLEQLAAMKSVVPEIEARHSIRMDAYDNVVLTLQEIVMLAPDEVADAAIAWYRARREDDPMPFAVFVNAARLDVGVLPLERPVGA